MTSRGIGQAFVSFFLGHSPTSRAGGKFASSVNISGACDTNRRAGNMFTANNTETRKEVCPASRSWHEVCAPVVVRRTCRAPPRHVTRPTRTGPNSGEECRPSSHWELADNDRRSQCDGKAHDGWFDGLIWLKLKINLSLRPWPEFKLNNIDIRRQHTDRAVIGD
ncbi:hypothetical protein EVAR_69039_1 [Eumeta japonica]|uniref:Uncharacterized protein n=1 Tax=Eumeta variegata TaxID=151549 RepID=A0A4C1TKT2_EUMVA|nr:hypothetical protein EVAR_69039_1 [Eumeta japonica]